MAPTGLINVSTAPVSRVGKAALPKNSDICRFIACLQFHPAKGKWKTKQNSLETKEFYIWLQANGLWKTTIPVVFNHPPALTLSNNCFNLTF
jgi:hypothetical protein